MKKTLGTQLKSARVTNNFTLREVEEVTDISNAYLSQLENDKISKPSANILYKLANLYGIPFDQLLVTAGIIDKTTKPSQSKKTKSFETYALYSQNLSEDEERQLVEYLRFIRFSKKSAR